jgi:hypothetical protein
MDIYHINAIEELPSPRVTRSRRMAASGSPSVSWLPQLQINLSQVQAVKITHLQGGRT